jgi:DNA processing protein
VEDAARILRLGLTAWPGVGPHRMRTIAEAVGGAWERLPDAWDAVWAKTARGAAPAPAPPLATVRALGEEQERARRRLGAHLLLPEDAVWPVALDPLDHPPPLLFVLGAVDALTDAAWRVAVIGARACTPYGREQAARFGAGLAAAGATVVSGAARGIDQCAMQGALGAGGRVVAVLGAGLDHPYPSSAEPVLAACAAGGGAAVSEFAFGTEPRAGNFPRRNRVLAGLAAATVVIQATRRSGSMNTVAWALSLGREVWALPGPVDSAASQGTHLLLRDGAQLAEGPLEVLRGLEQRASSEEMGKDSPLLEELGRRDASLAELAAALDQGEERVLLDLLELELRGQVLRQPSGLYHRCGPAPRAAGAGA